MVNKIFYVLYFILLGLMTSYTNNVFSYLISLSLAGFSLFLGYRFGIFISRKEGSALLVNRKYLEITFYDEDRKYDYFIPYSKVKALDSTQVVGKTSKRIYRINAALVPAIPLKSLGEEALVFNKKGEIIEILNFNEISF